ncbi:hypothetical protein [Methylobacterium gnaphalii]|uniref:hypothetical protein n=1 Tax=Methylobacterium gnaphalii TaxID=1010610 RepID=UPI0011BF532F|nr:hypothetical protein [Methylobacterium gnaphalii]
MLDLHQAVERPFLVVAPGGLSDILDQGDELVRNGTVEIVMVWLAHGGLPIPADDTQGHAERMHSEASPFHGKALPVSAGIATYLNTDRN